MISNLTFFFFFSQELYVHPPIHLYHIIRLLTHPPINFTARPFLLPYTHPIHLSIHQTSPSILSLQPFTIHPFIHPSLYFPLNQPFTKPTHPLSPIHSPLRSFPTHPIIHPPTHALNHSTVHQITLPIHSSLPSPLHLCIHPPLIQAFIHPLTQPFNRTANQFTPSVLPSASIYPSTQAPIYPHPIHPPIHPRPFSFAGQPDFIV